MKKTKIAQHYDSTSYEWFKDIASEPNKYYYSMYFKELFCDDSRGKTALDIGCGGGIFTMQLAKEGYRKVYGIDFSSNMIQSLKKIVKKDHVKNVYLKHADAEYLPFDDGSLDFVIGVGVLECLRSPDKALGEIYRTLKKDGKASIRFANSESIWELLENLKKSIGRPTDPHFTRHYDLKDMEDKLIKLGFKIEDISGTVIFPLFLLPKWMDNILNWIFVRSKIAYALEKVTFKKRFFIRKVFYAYVIKVRK